MVNLKCSSSDTTLAHSRAPFLLVSLALASNASHLSFPSCAAMNRSPANCCLRRVTMAGCSKQEQTQTHIEQVRRQCRKEWRVSCWKKNTHRRRWVTYVRPHPEDVRRSFVCSKIRWQLAELRSHLAQDVATRERIGSASECEKSTKLAERLNLLFMQQILQQIFHRPRAAKGEIAMRRILLSAFTCWDNLSKYLVIALITHRLFDIAESHRQLPRSPIIYSWRAIMRSAPQARS